jgi:hypothetical protein
VGHPDLIARRRALGAIAVLALAAALLLGGPRAAAASPPGPSTLSTGFVDDGLFQLPGPTADLHWLGDAESLASNWVRLTADWQAIAYKHVRGAAAANPANPGYYWPLLDEAIRAAAATHQHVLMMIYAAPTWAEGPHRPPGALNWEPNATDYGAFVRAVATRYSGHYPDPLNPGHDFPAVTTFQIWNEPNEPVSLSPQWTRVRRGVYTPASPGIYRRLLNTGYANIKAVQPHAYVLAAGTAPYGDPPGGLREPPLVFDRALLCLNGPALKRERCPDPAHFDAFDDHPYALNPLIHALDPDDTSVPDVHKVIHLLAVARRDRTLAPVGPKAMWVTELDWGSNPPDRTQGSLDLQRRYLDYALYELWRQNVSHVLWFELADPGPGLNVFSGAGVYFQNGQPKPSAQAFHFPFIAVPSGGHGHGLIVWGRAPAAGAVTIENGNGHTWQPQLTLTTTPGGIFYGHVPLRPHLILRAVQGTLASPGWRAVSSPNAA